MRDCWLPSQSERPTFASLAQTFRQMYEEETGTSLGDVGYLEVSDDAPEKEGRGGTALGRAFSKLASRLSMAKRANNGEPAYLNPVYQRKSSLVQNPVFAEATSDGANELYDMGEDDVTMELPARRDEAFGFDPGSKESGDDLYDMGNTDTERPHAVPVEGAVVTASEVTGSKVTGSEMTTADAASDADDDVYGNFGFDDAGAGAGAGNGEETTAGPGVHDVGKRVQVQGYACGGTLAFVGPHRKKDGLRCGVILDKPLGKNNGTVQVCICVGLYCSGVLVAVDMRALSADEDDVFGF